MDSNDAQRVLDHVKKQHDDELAVAKMKIMRLTNLLGDIVAEATNNPQRLTAFNSPLLQLACIEVWNHNNPQEPVDERTEQIYRQMAMVGYNV